MKDWHKALLFWIPAIALIILGLFGLIDLRFRLGNIITAIIVLIAPILMMASKVK